MTDKPYTAFQKEDISRAVTYGLTASKLAMYGAIQQDTRNLKLAHKRLCERGAYEEKTIGKNIEWRPVKRDVLTMAGFRKFVQELPQSDPLKSIENKERKISIRNGRSDEKLIRICRQSDAQNFFHSVGVESPYTFIKNFNANPFVFGFPECSSKTPDQTLTEAVMESLIEYVKDRRDTEYPLSEPNQYCPAALFLPNSYNPKSKVYIDNTAKEKKGEANTPEGKQGRSHNNSVGILFDFANQYAYVVFKQFGRKTQPWKGKAYQSWLVRCSGVIKTLGIKNSDPLTGLLNDAIILCETNGELMEIAKQSDKMRSPFKHIVPIVMNQKGADTIGTILAYGLDGYDYELSSEINEKIKEIEWYTPPKREGEKQTPPRRMRYNGTPAIAGTMINFRWLGDMKEHMKKRHKVVPYVVCYESQKKVYTEIAGLPDDHILIMEEPS